MNKSNNTKMSFCTFIFEEEDTKEFEKKQLKTRSFGFVTYLCRYSPCNLYDFFAI